MNPALKKRILRTLVIVLIGVAIGGLLALQEIANTPKQSPKPVAGIKIGGPFTLLNQDGETVTQDTYKGQPKLIYFGFTYCPAICPTELQKIARALNTLGTEGEDIQPLFISVDPERDTSKVLKDYLSLYNPRLVGLTGTPQQISETLKEYRIYAAKVQDENMNEYTMDHSSFIYFMDAEDNLLGIYRSEDPAEKIVSDVRQYLENR